MTGGRLTQGLRRAAQVKPAGVAAIDGAHHHTWSETVSRVARAAGVLREAGLSTGGRVAILALNSHRYFEIYYAIPWAGGAIVPLNTRLALPELQYILEDSGAEILVVDEHFVDAARTIRERVPALRMLLHIADTPAPNGFSGYEALIAAGKPAQDAERHGSDLAGIFYTGGSTGKAKGVMLSHDNLVTNAVNGCYMIGYDPTSVYLHAAPMCYLTDGMSTLSITMAAGTHVFIPRFEVEACLDAMTEHGVTNIALVPTMIGMIVNSPGIEKRDLSHLRQFMFGSSPITEGTLKRAVELWPDMKFLHGWGMTELSPIGSMIPHHLRDPKVAGDRLKSCGVAPPNVEVIIADEEGREVPRGTIGEILVRGPIVMQGYWNKPEETAKALRGGWLHTGDAAIMDDEGLIYIVDRLKDMIISGGENVYSTEVENAISVMPEVAEVSVIGIPDPKWGEAVHAIVVPRNGATVTAEAVQAHCRNLIAGYKCPRSVELRTEPLPVSAAGKIQKNVLREPFWREKEKRVN
ncbi:MAG: class I adenylate-forming enzyme family protein [Pseudorhodoplanes sp.]|uniref:class I adenylate-forming enzyme family protein n=1 Tax=Pseudorhodoplanes sp. TaxID=1934341 RepID=UPI003D0DA093